jgi:serine O-acetyltransferase
MRPGDSSLEMSFRDLVFSDFARHRGDVRPSWLAVVTRIPTNPGLLASLLLRANQCLHRAGHARVAALLRTLGNVVLGVDQGGPMTIGPGLSLVHPAGLVMGNGVRIGSNVTLASGVVLAARYYDPKQGDQQGFATIGDGATLGAHAVVVGPVTIGRNAMVGANSVVLSDVPDNAVVMGVPARRIGTREPDGTGPDPARGDAPAAPATEPPS